MTGDQTDQSQKTSENGDEFHSEKNNTREDSGKTDSEGGNVCKNIDRKRVETKAKENEKMEAPVLNNQVDLSVAAERTMEAVSPGKQHMLSPNVSCGVF